VFHDFKLDEFSTLWTSSFLFFLSLRAAWDLGERRKTAESIIIELTEAFAKSSMTFEKKPKKILLFCFSLALSAMEAFPVAFPLRQQDTRLCSYEKEQEQRSIGDVVQIPVRRCRNER
jgi:hypothetical protein